MADLAMVLFGEMPVDLEQNRTEQNRTTSRSVVKTVLGFLCLWIVVAGFLGQHSFSQQPTPPTSLTFEDFKAKWEQTNAERVHTEFVLKETQDGQDSEFVVKIGDRRAGTSVPIKITLFCNGCRDGLDGFSYCTVAASVPKEIPDDQLCPNGGGGGS